MTITEDDLTKAGLEVAPLVWSKHGGFYAVILPFGGKMEIMWDLVRGVETFILYPGTPERLHFPTLESAQSAADDHHRAAVLGAIRKVQK